MQDLLRTCANFAHDRYLTRKSGSGQACTDLRGFPPAFLGVDAEEGVTSALTEVECLRTLDRLRILEGIPDQVLAERLGSIYELLSTLAVVEIDRPVLDRAAQPLPTTLGTLDAIHLATAQLWRETTRTTLTMATHDATLATAACALGNADGGGVDSTLQSTGGWQPRRQTGSQQR